LVNSLFSDNKTKSFCLDRLRAGWLNYLKGAKADELPFDLMMFSEQIARYNGNAGPLRYVKSLAEFSQALRKNIFQPTTLPETQQQILLGLSRIESKFASEKWLDEQIYQFYDASKDIVSSAPSLFSDFLNLFNQLSSKEISEFMTQIYPLYQAQTVFLEKSQGEGSLMRAKALVKVRQSLRDFEKRLLAVSGDPSLKQRKDVIAAESYG